MLCRMQATQRRAREERGEDQGGVVQLAQRGWDGGGSTGDTRDRELRSLPAASRGFDSLWRPLDRAPVAQNSPTPNWAELTSRDRKRWPRTNRPLSPESGLLED